MLPFAVLSTVFFLSRLPDVSSAKNEEAIPVIELRGEGKPMSSAQIRHLEEQAHGGPLPIKVERRSRPKDCKYEAQRNDWVTFHYKLLVEDGRRIYQTFDKEPISIQLGVDMTIKGLDQGLQGFCVGEQGRISVPWRLAQKEDRGKVWKHVPSEEHWIRFDVEMISITPFSLAEEFKFLDSNGDAKITESDLVLHAEEMKEFFGRGWPNGDIDNVHAARYFVKYFDINGDGGVDFAEYQQIIERDQKIVQSKKKSDQPKGSKRRQPGFAYILDFNNDGVVSKEEEEMAAERIEKGPVVAKDEL